MMARSLAKQKELTICYPTADSWEEAVQGFNSEEKLAGYKIDAIADAVQQAILLCEQVKAEPRRALVTKKAKKLQNLLENLVHELSSLETQRALTNITADNGLRDILSVSAPEASLGRAMLKAVQSMQAPFDHWILTYGQSRGGRPAQTERQALLYCLIRNYEEIFSTLLWNSAQIRLIAIATHLFPACQVSTSGLEDAVPRALEDFALWAQWDRMPKLKPYHRNLLESWIDKNPNDPEPPLTPAKPRVK